MHLPTYQTTFIVALPFLGSLAAALNPKCHPGGNFDLSKWGLETPIDDGKNQPLVISAAQLSAGNDGCNNGWQDKGSDHQWFFTVCCLSIACPKLPSAQSLVILFVPGSLRSALDRNPPTALW